MSILEFVESLVKQYNGDLHKVATELAEVVPGVAVSPIYHFDWHGEVPMTTICYRYLVDGTVEAFFAHDAPEGMLSDTYVSAYKEAWDQILAGTDNVNFGFACQPTCYGPYIQRLALSIMYNA